MWCYRLWCSYYGRETRNGDLEEDDPYISIREGRVLEVEKSRGVTDGLYSPWSVWQGSEKVALPGASGDGLLLCVSEWTAAQPASTS